MMQDIMIVLYARSDDAIPYIGVVSRTDMESSLKLFDIPRVNWFVGWVLFKINKLDWKPIKLPSLGFNSIYIQEIPYAALQPCEESRAKKLINPVFLLPSVFFVSYIIFDRVAKTSRLEAAVQPMEQYMYQHAS